MVGMVKEGGTMVKVVGMMVHGGKEVGMEVIGEDHGKKVDGRKVDGTVEKDGKKAGMVKAKNPGVSKALHLLMLLTILQTKTTKTKCRPNSNSLFNNVLVN